MPKGLADMQGDFPAGAAFGVGAPWETAQQPSGLASIFGGAYNYLGDLAKRLTLSSQADMQNFGDHSAGLQSVGPALEAAMLPMGGGVTTGVPRAAGEMVLGAGAVRDPALWHGISTVKLPKPVAEMNPGYADAAALAERSLSPADLQGGWLLPALGDRSMAGKNLTSVGGRSFEAPVSLEGGHGFMPANADTGSAWASQSGVVTGLAKKARKLAESGDPVYFPYTAMGERSVDFSHHVGDSLAEILKMNPASKEAAAAFDAKMMKANADFPAIENWAGVNNPNLRQFLNEQPGVVRNKFAKAMDTAEFQKMGMPSVAEVRHAVTDPRLLDVPTGAAGASVARLDPTGRVIKNPVTPHSTYDTHLGGEYMGGLEASVPKEVFYPDLIKSYTERGYEPFRHDYLMARPPKGTPIAQKADQKWVDDVSRWLELNGQAR